MAARIRTKHQDEIRTKIQTTQLINRLQNHALSDGEDELTPSRLKAIEILLRKSLPDLTATQLTGEDGGPVQVQQIERVIIDPKK
jgi:hypothetical protein